MKKRVLVLAFLFGIFSFTMGCGAGVISSSTENTLNTVNLEESKQGASKENKNEKNATDTDVKKKKENKDIPRFNTDGIIEKTVLYDENDVKIIASDIEYKNNSVKINMEFENNSDKDLSFISGSIGYNCNSINGVMLDGLYINADVAAGKKAKENFSIGIRELEMYGIFEIADFEVGFYLLDDSFNKKELAPIGVKTSIANSYNYSEDSYQNSIDKKLIESVYDCEIIYFAKDEIYNTNGVKIASEALVKNKDNEYALFVEVVNESEETETVRISDVAVNGLTISGWNWSTDLINAGKTRIMDLKFSSMLNEKYWEVFGLENINNVSFDIGKYDELTYETYEREYVEFKINDKDEPIDTSGQEVYNENGIRIIAKKIYESEYDYLDKYKWYLLVENNSGSVIDFDDSYDSLSINSFMTNYIMPSVSIPDGGYGVIEVEIYADDLEELDIKSIDEITEMEMTFEIEDEDGNDIAEADVHVTY